MAEFVLGMKIIDKQIDDYWAYSTSYHQEISSHWSGKSEKKTPSAWTFVLEHNIHKQSISLEVPKSRVYSKAELPSQLAFHTV